MRPLSCGHSSQIGLWRERNVPPKRIQSCLGTATCEGQSAGARRCCVDEGVAPVTAGTLLGGQVQGDRIELSAGGSWTAEYAGAIEPQVIAATRGINARSIAINLSRIEYLDTYGAWLIERTLRDWTSQGRDARLIGLREDYRGLFEKVHAGTQKLVRRRHGPTASSRPWKASASQCRRSGPILSCLRKCSARQWLRSGA